MSKTILFQHPHINDEPTAENVESHHYASVLILVRVVRTALFWLFHVPCLIFHFNAFCEHMCLLYTVSLYLADFTVGEQAEIEVEDVAAGTRVKIKQITKRSSV